MKWLVGLDVRPAGQGALRFASWLSRHGKDLRIDALHVMEGIDRSRAAELHDAAQAASERAAERAEAAAAFDELLVVGGEEPEAEIERVCTERKLDAIVVCREGASTDAPSERLGRVSRRLLRRLPVPVVVVRPELTPEDIHGGPIIVCADLEGDAAPALRFARRFGDTVGRSVVAAHVVRKVYEEPIYSQNEALAPRKATAGGEAQRKLSQWLESERANGVRVVIDEGPVIRRLLGIAALEEACMIVCGARVLGTTDERAFLSSTGTDLCAVSRVPVAVVPSDWRAV
jgi:nucleotide-binding universal stress UspA family protein